MSPDSRPLQGLLLSAASRCAQALLALISLMVLARYLGAHAWGLFATVALMVAVAELFVGPAVTEALLQRADRQVNHYDAVFWLVTGLASLLTLVLGVLAAPLSTLFGVVEQRNVLLALALLLPISAVNGLYQTLLQTQGRNRDLANVTAIATMVGSCAGLFAALADQGLWALFAIEAGRRITLMIGLLYLESWRPQWADAFRDADRLLQFNRHILADRMLRQADHLIPKALIAGLFGPQALGCFVIARRMLDELTMLLTTPLRTVANAAVARSAWQLELLHQVIESLYRTAALTALPVFLAVAALAPSLVTVLFGPGWDDVIVLIQVLMVVGIAQTTSTFSDLLLKSAGRPDASILLLGAAVLVQSLAIPLFMQWGVSGVALAIALRYLLCWPIELSLIRHALGIGWRAQLRPLWSPLFAALMMVLMISLLSPLLLSSFSAPAQLLIGLPLTLACYLAALAMLAPATVKLAFGLAQAVVRRDQLRFNSLLTVFAG